ncbi:MAG: hypothetical protein LBS38_02255 [Endomicrobium sp.]|nr:hypothetical protein [Endomicrobium sp.]
MHKFIFVFVLAVNFFIAVPASAQTFELTLKSCEDSALKNSPQIKSAKYQADAAKEVLDAYNEFFALA